MRFSDEEDHDNYLLEAPVFDLVDLKHIKAACYKFNNLVIKCEFFFEEKLLKKETITSGNNHSDHD